MKEHSLVYRITATAKDYYTFEGFIDKVNTITIIKDTFWLHPLANHINKPLFTQLPNEAILKRQRFSDTSQICSIICISVEKNKSNANRLPGLLQRQPPIYCAQ